MSKRNEHLVVVMVEPAPPREFVIWPMHITIVPWFPCKDKNELDRLLTKIAAKHEEFIVKVGKIDHFGNRGELTVNLVEDPGNLYKLHWDMFRTLEKNGFPMHQKTYLGEKYKPHITHQGRKHEREGDELVVDSYTLVKQLRKKKTGTMIKQVVKDYPLK